MMRKSAVTEPKTVSGSPTAAAAAASIINLPREDDELCLIIPTPIPHTRETDCDCV